MNDNLQWKLITVEDDDGSKRIYRMIETIPADFDTTVFTESVSVKWQFAEDGLPVGETGEMLMAFEDLLENLDNVEGNSFITFVYTGYGQREWSYYSKDYDKFLEELNVALADKPRFPIEIEHSHDPKWEYWHGVNEAISIDD